MLPLPQHIIPMPNRDKTWHEAWEPNQNLLNFPHPFRAVFLGPPNCGKTTTVKNILLRAQPEFEELVVVHCDPSYTQEYDDVCANVLEEIPAPGEWQGKVKTLVVLDDLEMKFMNKEQKRNLDRLFGFVSTHKNISVCLCAQDPFNVPPIVRRCSNLWVLWPMTDLDALATCARRTGMRPAAFRDIFTNVLHKSTDSLWIDLTAHSPAKLRKNGFIPIRALTEKP